MITVYDLGTAFRRPIPWRNVTIHVRRCDGIAPYIALYTRNNPRGEEYPLHTLASLSITEAEYVELVNPQASGGRLELFIDKTGVGAPASIVTNPRGGKVFAGSHPVTPTPSSLPPAEILEGREIVITADPENTVDVLINNFPLPPGASIQLMIANTADIQLWTQSGTATVWYIAEVKQ